MRLLIVEDEVHLNKTLSERLTKTGYTVDSCFDGEDALYYIENTQYDGIILDVMMPNRDGLEACQRLREFSDVPSIMLTAKADDMDKLMGFEHGADDYLTKPFNMGELLARIRALTRRRAEFSPNVLSFGNIALSRESFELSCGEEAVRLGNKEFQMLEMLLTSPGRLISTEQFMEHIWGYETEAEINVVWVYISYLRKKLAAIEATLEIKATRGVGYTLEEKVC